MDNNKQLRDLAEHLKELAEEAATKRYPDTLIIHPSDRRWFQTGQMRSSWQAKDIPVIESDFVQPGYATWIESTAFKPLKPLSPDFEQSDVFKNARLRIASAFGLPYTCFPDQPYKWQRQDGETIIAWMIRLDKHELLDDPAIRWETQKAVWIGIGNWFKRVAQIRFKVYIKGKQS